MKSTLKWLAIALSPLIVVAAVDLGMHGTKSLTYSAAEVLMISVACPGHNWLSAEC